MIVLNSLQTSLSGGIGRYSFELAKELYKLDKDNTKIVIREEDLELFSFADKEDLIVIKGINNSKERNIFEQFKLPKMIYKQYPNAILHYPDTMAPIFAKNKVVITIHDLAFKTLKGAFGWKTVLWKNVITNLSVKKADKIISITNFTEKEIKKHYPKLNKDKIHLVYNGFNNFSQENIEVNNVSEKIKNINKGYILTVSTISPRKNVNRLIEAFNIIKDNVDLNLIVAGKNGWLFESVYELVDKYQLKDRVMFTGGINDDELKYLYKNADVFIYPSIYEGFGLPPLEAMSYGVPCLVSNVTSMPEVVGEAAMLFDPMNVDEIANKLHSMCNDSNIKNNFSQLGFKRIADFSWKKCAMETLDVFNSLLKS